MPGPVRQGRRTGDGRIVPVLTNSAERAEARIAARSFFRWSRAVAYFHRSYARHNY